MSEAREEYPFDQAQRLWFWIVMIVSELSQVETDARTFNVRLGRVMKAYKRLQPLENAHEIKSKGLWCGITYSLLKESDPRVQPALREQSRDRPSKYRELYTGTRAERAAKCVEMLLSIYERLKREGRVDPDQLL